MDVSGLFYKVSFQEYQRANKARNLPEEELRMEYDAIELPEKMTTGAAGYDFHLPYSVRVEPDAKNPVIYTGVRVKMDPSWMLMLFPRSGLGFKYGLGLTNTVGIVDQDYYKADNEGHIAARLRTDEPVELQAGDRFMQGVLVPVGITFNELMEHQEQAERHGGMGSTGGGC